MNMHVIRLLCLGLFLVSLPGCLGSFTSGGSRSPVSTTGSSKTNPNCVSTNRYSYDKNIGPLMTQHCASCHSGAVPSGGISLDGFSANGASKWNAALLAMESGRMPPVGLPKVASSDVAMFKTWLGGGAPKSESDVTAACATSTTSVDCTSRPPVGESPLRRLSKRELTNTLVDIFGQTVVASVQTQLSQFPDEDRTQGFDTMSLPISEPIVLAQMNIAIGVAEAVASSTANLSAIDACLLLANTNDACLTTVLGSLGQRVFRRPLSATEVADYKKLFTDSRAAFNNLEAIKVLIASLLQSPDFLYLVHINGTAVAGQGRTYQLNAYELAARLSYTLWGSMPDAALMSAAQSGALLTSAGLSSEVDRMLNHAKARTHVRDFHSQWLRIDQMANFNYSAAFLQGQSTANLRASMQQEARDYMDYIIWEQQGSYADIMTSTFSQIPANGAALSTLYGASGTGRVTLPANREGILTRGVILAAGGTDTHSSIRRGVLVRRALLCENLSQPSASDFPTADFGEPAFDASLTSRQRWEQKTKDPGCMSCHGLINPPGFAMENYDAIGRFRTQERILDASTGALVNTLPINATVVPWIESRDESPISGAVELGRRLSRSEKATRCFSAQWFRYHQGRRENESDACVIDDGYRALANGGSIRSMLRQSVLSPEFKTVKIGD